MGQLEASLLAGDGAGECTLLVAKSSLSTKPEVMATQFNFTRGLSCRELR